MKIEKLNEELTKLYHVYGPQEEKEEGLNPEHRSKFDSKGIRHIMLSYFSNGMQDIVKHIFAMPDSWVIEFLKAQEDTEVEEIK